MRKLVATYSAQVQEIAPNPRNARTRLVKVLPHGSTFYYTVEIKDDLDVEVGQWYELTLLVSPVAYKDKESGKPAAFLVAWALAVVALTPAAAAA